MASSQSTTLPVRGRPQGTDSFDIVATYHARLAASDITKPVAAIEALVALLAASDYSTVFETLETVKRHSETLLASVRNPVPLQAGTDLFLQYLVTSLKTASPGNGTGSSTGTGTAGLSAAQGDNHSSFEDVRSHLVRNSRLFAARAIAARDGIADAGWPFVRHGKTILTLGASRAVATLLLRAAAQSKSHAASSASATATATSTSNPTPSSPDVGFKVIYVRDERRKDLSDRFVASLREASIPVAEISELAVAHVMSLRRQVDVVFAGAEAVTQSGGVISRLGTYQVAKLARENKPRLPFYVAAETHKFVRKFPLGQKDLGYEQTVLDFRTGEPPREGEDEEKGEKADTENAVDYTPPEYVSHLITENGVKLPSYVLEQLLDIYGALHK